MFIRCFPLYGYLITVHFFSPVVNYSASCDMVWFFSQHYGGETSNSPVLGWLVGIKPHVYQGFPPLWLFNDCLYTFFCQFYRPLWIISCRVKCFGFQVGTMEPHVYQGFPPLWLFNDCLYTYFCQFYRPLWFIPCWVKWFGFPVGTMEVKHQTNQYSDG